MVELFLHSLETFFSVFRVNEQSQSWNISWFDSIERDKMGQETHPSQEEDGVCRPWKFTSGIPSEEELLSCPF